MTIMHPDQIGLEIKKTKIPILTEEEYKKEMEKKGFHFNQQEREQR